MEASGAYIKANNTRDAVRDAMQTVNNLLGLIGESCCFYSID